MAFSARQFLGRCGNIIVFFPGSIRQRDAGGDAVLSLEFKGQIFQCVCVGDDLCVCFGRVMGEFPTKF